MPIVVKAVSEDDFNKWVSVQKSKMTAAQAGSSKTWSKSQLMSRGQKVYAKSCASCHGPTGAGVPGVFPPMTGSKIATGPVSAHLDMVINGKPGTAMSAFKDQLSDVDLAAVVTFERNGLGNKNGGVVQPSQIKALR